MHGLVFISHMQPFFFQITANRKVKLNIITSSKARVLVCQHITENTVAGVPRLSLLAVELKMKWIDAVEVKLLSLDADTNGTGDLNYLSVSLLWILNGKSCPISWV